MNLAAQKHGRVPGNATCKSGHAALRADEAKLFHLMIAVIDLQINK
jgi:hypothetical protein